MSGDNVETRKFTEVQKTELSQVNIDNEEHDGVLHYAIDNSYVRSEQDPIGDL